MEFNPYDPDLQQDPYPIYRRLREKYPLHYNEKMKFWTLSRYHDVAAALRNTTQFISSKGIAVGVGRVEADFTQSVPILIMMDPPEHTRLRKLVSGAFAPRRVAALEPAIRQIARTLLDGLGNSPEPDLVRDFANPLPTIVIAELLGVPSEDRDQFKRWSNAVAHFDPANPQGLHPASDRGPAFELAGYLANILAERRKAPRDDLLSQLLATRVDGRALTEAELLGFGFILLVAGNETTTNLISNAAILLDRHPDARRRLVEDPALMPRAVEEFLRFDPPVQGLARTNTSDLELYDQTIPEGDSVLLLFASANRDERVFPDPDRFDIARSPNDHLSFGLGAHFCLGSGLARLEGRVALRELLARFPDFSFGSGQVERVRSGPIRGAARLPIDLGG